MFSCFLASVFIYLSGVFLNYFATHHIHIIDNEKVGIVNKKALELDNIAIFHRGRQ